MKTSTETLVGPISLSSFKIEIEIEIEAKPSLLVYLVGKKDDAREGGVCL